MLERLNQVQATELLQRPNNHILSLELAQRINVVGKDLPDDQLIANLIAPWYWRSPPREVDREYRGKTFEVPKDWSELMNTLDHKQIQWVGLFFERSLWLGVRSLGQLRQVVANRGLHRGVGISVGKPFGFIAFKKAEEIPSITE